MVTKVTVPSTFSAHFKSNFAAWVLGIYDFCSSQTSISKLEYSCACSRKSILSFSELLSRGKMHSIKIFALNVPNHAEY